MAAVEPTALEVYFVTLLNRARMNPKAEAARYGITINEGLPAGTISRQPLPPLAINAYLTDAARQHSVHMLDVDAVAHQSIGDSTNLKRLIRAGYQPVYPAALAENLGWHGASSGWPDPQAAADLLHRELFADTTVPGRGHRIILMDPDMTEIGVGYVPGSFASNAATWNAMMVTQDFAFTSGDRFITGVAYTDTVRRDRVYTPGEGLFGVLIQAQRLSDGRLFTITTGQAGAYSLQVPPGVYRVTASGGGLPTPIVRDNVSMANSNVLADFRIRPSLAPSLSNVGVLHVDGTPADDLISLNLVGSQLVVKVNASTWSFPADQVHATEIWAWQGNDTLLGSAMQDIVQGMWGNDLLFGRGGDDFLSGGAGNDTLDGGGGNDILYANSGNDMILGGPGNDLISGGSGRDNINGGMGDNSSDYDPLETRLNIQHLLI